MPVWPKGNNNGASMNNMNIDDYTVKDVLKTLIGVLNSLRDGETRKLNSNEVLDLFKR